MQPTGEFQPAQPAVERKGGSKGLVLAVVFLALCSLVLGGLYCYEKFIAKSDDSSIADTGPKEKCDTEETEKIDGVEKSEILGVATANTELKVRTLVDDLYHAVNDKKWFIQRIYGDNGPLLKLDNEGNFTSASRYYGLSDAGRGVTNADREISYDKVFGEVFEKYDMKKVDNRPNRWGSEALYYENSDGLFCWYSLFVAGGGDLDNSAVNVECASEDWLGDEDRELMTNLAKAYAKSEGSQIGIIDASEKDIKQNGEYQTVQADVDDAVALFYRKGDDSDWKFFKVVQNSLECSEYNTEELKSAYNGELCYENGNESKVK